MSSSLTLTCAFCGLRFANSPLLELHIRDDHLQRDQHAEPDRGAAVRTQVPQPRADGSSRTQSQASKPRRTTKEVTIMKAAPRRAMTALRAVIRTLRHFNAKLLLAAEAMLRPIGVAVPASGGQARRTVWRAGTATGRAQRRLTPSAGSFPHDDGARRCCR